MGVMNMVGRVGDSYESHPLFQSLMNMLYDIYVI